MPLSQLPYDLLLHIAFYLDLYDLHSLQISCKSLYFSLTTRPVYRKLADDVLRRCRPLPLKGFQRIGDLTTEDFVNVVEKAWGYERAWRRRSPRALKVAGSDDTDNDDDGEHDGTGKEKKGGWDRALSRRRPHAYNNYLDLPSEEQKKDQEEDQERKDANMMNIHPRWYRVIHTPTSSLSSSRSFRTAGSNIHWLSPITSSYILCSTKSGSVICWDIQRDMCLAEWSPDSLDREGSSSAGAQQAARNSRTFTQKQQGQGWDLWKCRVDFPSQTVFFIMAKVMRASYTDTRLTSFALIRLQFDEHPSGRSASPRQNPPEFGLVMRFMMMGVVMNVFILDPGKRLVAAFVWRAKTNTIGLVVVFGDEEDVRDEEDGEGGRGYVFIDTGIDCVMSSNWSCILFDQNIVIHCEDSDAVFQHFYPLSMLREYLQPFKFDGRNTDNSDWEPPPAAELFPTHPVLPFESITRKFMFLPPATATTRTARSSSPEPSRRRKRKRRTRSGSEPLRSAEDGEEGENEEEEEEEEEGQGQGAATVVDIQRQLELLEMQQGLLDMLPVRVKNVVWPGEDDDGGGGDDERERGQDGAGSGPNGSREMGSRMGIRRKKKTRRTGSLKKERKTKKKKRTTTTSLPNPYPFPPWYPESAHFVRQWWPTLSTNSSNSATGTTYDPSTSGSFKPTTTATARDSNLNNGATSSSTNFSPSTSTSSTSSIPRISCTVLLLASHDPFTHSTKYVLAQHYFCVPMMGRGNLELELGRKGKESKGLEKVGRRWVGFRRWGEGAAMAAAAAAAAAPTETGTGTEGMRTGLGGLLGNGVNGNGHGNENGGGIGGTGIGGGRRRRRKNPPFEMYYLDGPPEGSVVVGCGDDSGENGWERREEVTKEKGKGKERAISGWDESDKEEGEDGTFSEEEQEDEDWTTSEEDEDTDPIKMWYTAEPFEVVCVQDDSDHEFGENEDGDGADDDDDDDQEEERTGGTGANNGDDNGNGQADSGNPNANANDNNDQRQGRPRPLIAVDFGHAVWIEYVNPANGNGLDGLEDEDEDEDEGLRGRAGREATLPGFEIELIEVEMEMDGEFDEEGEEEGQEDEVVNQAIAHALIAAEAEQQLEQEQEEDDGEGIPTGPELNRENINDLFMRERQGRDVVVDSDPKRLRFVTFPAYDGYGSVLIESRRGIGGDMNDGEDGGVVGIPRTLEIPEGLDLDKVETINLDQSQGAVILSVKDGRVFIVCYE
ncbi:hypothetical protein K435DRAFT_795700 [Dendrothele bispora CBS 962.96]|uniref:F-box domain-containing protein n=1 Tax=Dendrothele bispora (strain CBS 962.96) TaxID=1314807 RepID=A0A4S8M7U6_DENBC|nr:hypothetical protein K435DRAFT_795700 [Dendrothele bispora CBS 962.96]